MHIRKWAAALCAAGAVAFGVSMAQAAVVDLTAGGSGTINGAIYQWTDEQPTGTGVIDSFVRIQDANDDVVEGYNTSYRPVEFDEITDPNFTRDLLLSEVPVVTISGTDYREFLLDINQIGTRTGSLLSLDELEIYLGSSGGLTNYPDLGNLVYDMDAGEDSWVVLDASLNSGSGSGDMFAYIPDSLFSGANQYVYLYSLFGEHYPNNDGFEEWAVRTGEAQVPEPGMLGMLAAGLFGLPLFRRKTAAR